MNLVGERFGRWTVLEPAQSKGYVKYWKCQCDCGTIRNVRQMSLRSGISETPFVFHMTENCGQLEN